MSAIEKRFHTSTLTIETPRMQFAAKGTSWDTADAWQPVNTDPERDSLVIEIVQEWWKIEKWLLTDETFTATLRVHGINPAFTRYLIDPEQAAISSRHALLVTQPDGTKLFVPHAFVYKHETVRHTPVTVFWSAVLQGEERGFMTAISTI